MRLDKFLAQSGIGNSKTVRIYIQDGKVKVNGQVVIKPAMAINENEDIVEYLDEKISYLGKAYYMFNKPSGCVTARRDDKYKTVFDFFLEENMNGVSHVGRLDKDTEGLLLLTNDGELNNKLMSPLKHVDKKYFFIALGSLDEESINRLEQGVSIGVDEEITKPSKLEKVKSGIFKDFENESELIKVYNDSSNYYKQPAVSGYLTISEGRKHQVKRMLKAVGCHVIYLKRISIGDLELDESLGKGQYRSLEKDEIKKLLGKFEVS